MKATRTFTDKKGKVRKNGEEWLITIEDTETHIPNVYEEVWTQILFYMHQVFVFSFLHGSCIASIPRHH